MQVAVKDFHETLLRSMHLSPRSGCNPAQRPRVMNYEVVTNTGARRAITASVQMHALCVSQTCDVAGSTTSIVHAQVPAEVKPTCHCMHPHGTGRTSSAHDRSSQKNRQSSNENSEPLVTNTATMHDAWLSCNLEQARTDYSTATSDWR